MEINKSFIIVLYLLLHFTCSYGQLPQLKLVEYQGQDTLDLYDILEEDKNYLLMGNADWCSICHRTLEEWVYCYEEWLCAHNLEVIGISTDGFHANQQAAATNLFFRDLPYNVYYTESSDMKAAFGTTGLPHSYFISQLNYIGSVGGGRLWDEMSDSLAAYFPLLNNQDLDGDGVYGCADCDDSDPSIPTTDEIPYNGIDDDCNVRTRDDDLDNDGYLLADDCDDNDRYVNPNAIEICNDIDDNCNGEVDDGLVFKQYWLDSDEDDFGDESISIMSCYAYNWDYVKNPDDCDDNDPKINPESIEIPNNGIDENCDGFDYLTAVSNLESSGIKLYPNPVHTYLNFTFPNNEIYTVSIYDTNGFRLLSCSGKSRIDMSELDSGSYTAEVKSNEGQVLGIDKVMLIK